MGVYDRTMKVLVDADPEAIAQFVLNQWRLKRGPGAEVENFKVLAQLNTEFQGSEADADGLLLVETVESKQFLMHIEFQSTRDRLMPDRLLDYCLRARRKHGPLPIISCVIYLRDNGFVEEPPWCWPVFEDHVNMVFDYVCLKLWDVPRADMMALRQPALWPLSLLTKGEVNRIIVKEMFAGLLANKLHHLLPIGQTIAGWLLPGNDLEWLKKEYFKMLDFFKDSPAYAWMTESAREEGREEARRELLEANRRIQQALQEFRQIVVTLVARSFPDLAHLAEKQVYSVENQERLARLILQVSAIQDAGEMVTLLSALDEDEKDTK